MNSGYTPDELAKLLGVVDVSKSLSERANKSIHFAINTLNTLKKRKTNEDSTDQVMLRRDITLVTSDLSSLLKSLSINTDVCPLTNISLILKPELLNNPDLR